MAPVKARARVLLAPGCDVLVPHDLRNGITPSDCLHQMRQCRILLGRKTCALQAFQLDADGVVVALLAPVPGGCACMPGPLVATHELLDAASAPHHEMRRHLQAANALEIRVRIKVQRVGKQLLNVRPAIFARRQADGVQHEQIDCCARRARPEIGAVHTLRQTAPALVPSGRNRSRGRLVHRAGGSLHAASAPSAQMLSRSMR